MKKILWFLFAFVLAAGLGKVLWNTWQTTEYFQVNGREATLTIGKRYNAARWTSPLPIKQIHTYTAVMAPDHQVLVETDQALEEKKEYSIRFLLRDLAVEGRQMSLRPLAGAIRIRVEIDGTPVKLADTDIFDRTVAKAMGPMGTDYYERPKPVAEAAPSREKPTVPYLIADAGDNRLEIIWKNSAVGEWIIFGFWCLAIQMAVLTGWSTPFSTARRIASAHKDFVHPSMQRIDADKSAPSAKLAYNPKAPPPDVAPVEPEPAPPPKPRVTIPAPASTKSTPAPAAPVSTATTAPFIPRAGSTEPMLKLKRKPKE